MNESIKDFAMSGINRIIEAVKGVAPKIWEVYMKQQIIKGIWCFIATIGFISCAIWINSARKKIKDTDWCEDDVTIANVFSVIGTVIAIALALVCLGAGIARIINPDYYIIQDLVYIARSLT